MKRGLREFVLASSIIAVGCGPAVATTGSGEEGSSSSATTGRGSTNSAPTAPSTGSAGTAAPVATSETSTPDPTTVGTTGEVAGESSTSSTVFFDHPQPILSCSVWDDECPEGQKCTAWSRSGSEIWDDARCSPVGPDQIGEPCAVEGGPTSGIDSCAQGSMCWSVDPDTNMGVCAELCVGSENASVCNDPTTTCLIGNQGSINVCSATCDPLSQNCPDGEACYGTTPHGRLACIRPNTPLITPPDDLTPALCPPGSTAVSPDLDANCEDNELCCASWCDLSLDVGEQQCLLEQQCSPWDEQSLWPVDVGICLNHL